MALNAADALCKILENNLAIDVTMGLIMKRDRNVNASVAIESRSKEVSMRGKGSRS